MTVYYPDSTVESADWIKQSWDVTHSDDELRRLLARIEDLSLVEVRRWLVLPSFRYAPELVLRALRSRERELIGQGV